QYCLGKIDPDGVMGEQTIPAVKEQMKLSQQIFSRGRSLSEGLALKGTQVALKDHPNRGVLENWVKEAMALGFKRKDLETLLNQWMKEGAAKRGDREKKTKEIVDAVNAIHVMDPI